MKKAVTSTVIVVAVVLIVGFVPIMEVPYTVQYQDTEIYYETEPLHYRKLDSISGASEDWIKHWAAWAAASGYEFPDNFR